MIYNVFAESARICAETLDFRGEVEYCKFLREKNNGVIGAGLTEEEAKKYFVSLPEREFIIAIILAGNPLRKFYDPQYSGAYGNVQM